MNGTKLKERPGLLAFHEVDVSATWTVLMQYEDCVQDRRHFCYCSSGMIQVRQQFARRFVTSHLHQSEAVALECARQCVISARSLGEQAVRVVHAVWNLDRAVHSAPGTEPIDLERSRRLCQWRLFYEQELPKHPQELARKKPKLSNAEKQTILRMRENGETLEDIAGALDRGLQTVCRELQRVAV